jgi:large subunit ribosomal protein L4
MSKKLMVYDMQGKKIEEIDSLFNGKVNQAVMAQVAQMYLANKRHGLASTKTRGEVSGGGKKPWKQKGTGRARAGSTRSPLWRHGGVVFGPHPRDFHYALSPKIRNAALLSALNEKNNLESILVLDKIALPQAKSKELKKLLDGLKIKEKVLFIFNQMQEDFQRAARNMPTVTVAMAASLNALEVLRAKKIIFSRDALEFTAGRLKPIS